MEERRKQRREYEEVLQAQADEMAAQVEALEPDASAVGGESDQDDVEEPDFGPSF